MIARLQPIRRLLSTSTTSLYAIPKRNKLPPRPKHLVKEEDLEEKFLHGGRGPGGQKINKCNSKVQLRHIPTGIVIDCQATRSKEQNRAIAREKLALKLDDYYNPGTSRNAVLTERAQKLKQSKSKKSNRKYKKLEEEKAQKKEEAMLEESPAKDVEDEFEEFLKNAKVEL
ncbi:hypothetical protein Cantr_02868 [Candida viswanathii]|uniref:Prokaryotic-type class I peptide chain release factors domain-containing protein n=1 Tax=Candida viswanathii TaxID=5486 RepID=A0A367YNH0_9ASCO|nr:hypothetical protein Cantr_02868 [Candida viswanathii]